MCPPMWAHWCHLSNMIELSVCGGDAVLCQINLTSCLLYMYLLCITQYNLIWPKDGGDMQLGG